MYSFSIYKKKYFCWGRDGLEDSPSSGIKKFDMSSPWFSFKVNFPCKDLPSGKLERFLRTQTFSCLDREERSGFPPYQTSNPHFFSHFASVFSSFSKSTTCSYKHWVFFMEKTNFSVADWIFVIRCTRLEILFFNSTSWIGSLSTNCRVRTPRGSKFAIERFIALIAAIAEEDLVYWI